MVENPIRADKGNGKQNDGGILGRQLVGNVRDAHSFMAGLSSRLCFILGGLRGEPSDIEGAAGLISDLEERVCEERDILGEAIERAEDMVSMAMGACPILPDTTTEAELFEAIKQARGSYFARAFICEAGLAAARIYKERFSFPKGGPGPEDVAEAVETATAALPTDMGVVDNGK